jgi:hypothetical protein
MLARSKEQPLLLVELEVSKPEGHGAGTVRKRVRRGIARLLGEG